MLICNWIGDLWVAISISCKAPRRRNTRLTSENNWSLFSQCSPATQVGVTKPIFSIPLLFPFFKITKHWLPVWYHVNIWQRSPQLSSGDTCQIWTWLKVSNIYLPYIKISRYGEINERSFSNPHLEHKLSGPHFHRVGMKDLLLVPLGSPRLASPSVRCQSVLDWCRCQSPGRSVQLMAWYWCPCHTSDPQLKIGGILAGDHSTPKYIDTLLAKKLLHPGMMCLFCDYFYFISPRGLRTGCLV